MLAVPCSCAITYTLRMADSADLKDRLEDFLGRELGAPVSVTDLVRLPGGASRETWSLTASGPAGEMRLVLRREDTCALYDLRQPVALSGTRANAWHGFENVVAACRARLEPPEGTAADLGGLEVAFTARPPGLAPGQNPAPVKATTQADGGPSVNSGGLYVGKATTYWECSGLAFLG